MKNLHIFLFLLCVSCQYSNIPKPKNLLSPQKMEEILYDIAILNAARNVDYAIFDDNFVDSKSIIYKKNNIDSVDLKENLTYYAASPKEYQQILKNIEIRLKKEDSLLRIKQMEDEKGFETLKTDQNPDAPKSF